MANNTQSKKPTSKAKSNGKTQSKATKSCK